MKNILQQAVSRDEVVEILKNSPLVPLLPPMGDAAWKHAARKASVQPWLKRVQEMALTEIDQPMPELTEELYQDFAATGTRVNFERLYFDRRRRLGRAAIAVLTMPDADARLKQSLLAKMQAIFDEVSWALPAHVENKTGVNPMCIDLFAAETANLFAELLNIFSDIMPESLKSATRQRLRKQFFENYFNVHGWWLEITNNWSAVCHQGVIGAALAVEEDVDLLADMLLRMKVYLPNFLKGFGADGGTAEGPGYWSYGFGWFAVLNEQLEKRTRNQLSIMEGDPKVVAAAHFGPFGLLEGSLMLNFSDGGPTGTLRASTVQYLADRLKDVKLAQTADVCWASPASPVHDLHHLRGDLFLMGRMLLMAPEELRGGSLPVHDTYLPDTQWMLSRSRDQKGQVWEFGAKAGYNHEHHNHNDVGSYILNAGGQRVIIEIGAPEYTRDFFSEKRYTFLAARSLGHSVPLVNGVEQAAGEAYRGVVLKQAFSQQHVEFVVDLTAAYPTEARLQKLVRSLSFDKQAGKLSVKDAYELKNDDGMIETAIITEVEPKLQGDGAVLSVAGKPYFVRTVLGTRIREIQKHTYRKHHGGDAAIYRIVLIAPAPATYGALEYEIVQM